MVMLARRAAAVCLAMCRRDFCRDVSTTQPFSLSVRSMTPIHFATMPATVREASVRALTKYGIAGTSKEDRKGSSEQEDNEEAD